MKIFQAHLWQRAAVLAAVASIGWLTPGCGDAGDTGDANRDPSVDLYDVRGEIVGVKNVEGEDPKLRIWHERIEQFKTISGNIEPMDAMVMDFPVSEDVEVGSLSEGDKVRFRFEVRWEGPQRGYRVTSIEPLPDDTEFDLDRNTPAGATDTASEMHDHDHDHDHGHDHEHNH
jgi:Cu/Ag efflux protein CusF